MMLMLLQCGMKVVFFPPQTTKSKKIRFIETIYGGVNIFYLFFFFLEENDHLALIKPYK